MNMNLRVSRSFIEGMKYPGRISSKKNLYENIVRQNSVAVAWKNTGNYIKKETDKYGRNFYVQGK